jgi:hypothetical protein
MSSRSWIYAIIGIVLLAVLGVALLWLITTFAGWIINNPVLSVAIAVSLLALTLVAQRFGGRT